MKKARKFFFSLFIILIAAAAVFFIGWIQFYVKPGNCGIMTSKTGGIYESPVIAGKFLWRWERLLPTNVQIDTYSLTPYTAKKSYTGSLPSAQIYQKMADPKPDFSYDIQIEMTVSVSPEGILELVKAGKITSQEELDSWLDSRIDFASRKITDSLLSRKLDPAGVKALSQSDLEEIMAENRTDLKNLTIVSAEIKKASVPDIEVYESCKKLYELYQAELSDSLKSQAKQQAASILDEDRTMTQLEKFGKLLQQYPELQDIAKSGDITVIMNTLRNLR